MRFLLILFLQACSFAETASRPPLNGTWVNEHETRGFTQVIVRQDGARTIVHGWGACKSTDCDLGEHTPISGMAYWWRYGGMVLPRHECNSFLCLMAEWLSLQNQNFMMVPNVRIPGQAEFFRRQETKSDSHGWPTTVLIDRDGKIVFYGDGMELEKLRDALKQVGVW